MTSARAAALPMKRLVSHRSGSTRRIRSSRSSAASSLWLQWPNIVSYIAIAVSIGSDNSVLMREAIPAMRAALALAASSAGTMPSTLF